MAKESQGETRVASGADCTVLAEIPGPEDFVVQRNDDDKPYRLLVSSQDRRSGAEGAIYSVTLDGWAEGATHEMKLKGRGDCSFRPHGVYLRQDVTETSEDGKKKTKDLLYVINHHDDPLDLSADRSCVPAGVGSSGRPTSVEVFEIGYDSLTMTRRLSDAEFLVNGNDLVVDEDGTIYVTVPPGLFAQAREPVLRSEYSKVLRYRPGTDPDWTVVSKLAGYANGIEFMPSDHGQLLVSTSMTGKVYRLSKDETCSRCPERLMAFDGAHDNFTWSDDRLLLASHADRRRYLQHSRHPDARSPSSVSLLEPTAGGWKRTKIFLDDGTLLSGVSTAACAGGRLILGQVFGPSVLSCPVSSCPSPKHDMPANKSSEAETKTEPGANDPAGDPGAEPALPIEGSDQAREGEQ